MSGSAEAKGTFFRLKSIFGLNCFTFCPSFFSFSPAWLPCHLKRIPFHFEISMAKEEGHFQQLALMLLLSFPLVPPHPSIPLLLPTQTLPHHQSEEQSPSRHTECAVDAQRASCLLLHRWVHQMTKEKWSPLRTGLDFHAFTGKTPPL